MRTIEELDGCFSQLNSRLDKELPDGIEQVTLETLSSLNLIADKSAYPPASSSQSPLRANTPHVPWHYFHVNDSGDKITLYNDQFIAWIVPQQDGDDEASTLVIIACDDQKGVHPELAFRTTGVYNSSRTVLRILERYLDDIEENNSTIKKLSSAT